MTSFSDVGKRQWMLCHLCVLYDDFPKLTPCLKITEKVSFYNIATLTIWVDKEWRVFENLNLAVKQCYQTSQVYKYKWDILCDFQTLWLGCGCSKKLWKEGTRILSLRLKYFRTGFCNSCSCSASCWLRKASADSSSAFSLAFRLDLEKAEVSSRDSVSCFSALFRLCFKLLFLPKRPFQRTRVFLGSTSAKVSSYLK